MDQTPHKEEMSPATAANPNTTDPAGKGRGRTGFDGVNLRSPGQWLTGLILAACVFLVYLSYLFFMRVIPSVSERGCNLVMPRHTAVDDTLPASVQQIAAREKSVASLQKELAKYTPQVPYLVVNTTENTFRLYAGTTLLREGVCSTGSYTLLTAGDDRKWMFQTPKGVFRIRDKRTSPVWKKPDWAFVEEGLPVPSPNHPSRFEYGTLGDYALHLGDGYMIHGTLYQRFLGLPVTHGCIRMGDADLETVYRKMGLGAKVFIY